MLGELDEVVVGAVGECTGGSEIKLHQIYNILYIGVESLDPVSGESSHGLG